eukprot:GHVU01104112.1.p2 GENE.GHVU01104112.1~~GHVU01104112.1.p2  ORF type:complete len:115 (+),score=2.28 GHVU01104112.1:279-623(+)
MGWEGASLRPCVFLGGGTICAEFQAIWCPMIDLDRRPVFPASADAMLALKCPIRCRFSKNTRLHRAAFTASMYLLATLHWQMMIDVMIRMPDVSTRHCLYRRFSRQPRFDFRTF